MPKKTTPRYGINYGWSLGEGPWNTDMDSNLKALDTLIGTTIISDALATPPASPAAGDSYIVAASATGAWAGKSGQVATYIDSAWKFIVPKRGLRAEVQSASGFKYYNGTAWTAEPSGGGGATALSGLTDVNVTEGGAIDQYSLVWDNATSKWIAKDVSGTGGATALSDLTDVDVTSTAPSNGQVLTWNDTASKWQNQDPTGGGGGIPDAPTDGNIYGRQNASWVEVPSGGATALSALTDVNVTEGATIDQYSLVWDDATSKWIAKDVSGTGGATALSGLSDVDVTEGAGIDQFSLVWDNATSKWVAKGQGGNGTAPVALISYVPGTLADSATLLKAITPLVMTLVANLVGSYAKCDVAPTGAVSCDITQNGTSIGSINFAAGSTTGTFTFASAVTTTPGDIIAVTAPSTADSTFAGVAVALYATTQAVFGRVSIVTAAHTFAPADNQGAVVTNSAASVTQTMPSPTGSTGNFANGWRCTLTNINTGVVTIAVPSGVHLDGVLNGTATLLQNQGVTVFTDGTDLFTNRGEGNGVSGVVTVQLQLGGSSTGITTSISECHYMLIGNVCTVVGAVRLTSKGTATGAAAITGLPFAAQSTVSDLASPLQFQANNLNASFTSVISASINAGTSSLSLQKFASGVISNVTDADLTNTTVIRFSGSYFVS